LDIEVIKYNPINSNIVYVAGNKKIWKSIDGGNTWGNPIFTNPNPQNANFIDFEINSINPNVLYASTNWSGKITTGSGAEFFTSLDGGVSWYNFSPPNRRILGSTNTSICPDSSACDAIAIDVTPADPNKVFISFHNGGGIG